MWAEFGGAAVAGASAVAVVVSALLTRAAVGPLSIWASGVLALASVAGDLANRRGVRIFRPLAVFRQVPRFFGHSAGPWWAAARYGVRMGVGPATILASWSWWAGFVMTVAGGPVGAVVGATAFAVGRTITMALAVSGVEDGVAMAKRARRLDSLSGVGAKTTALLTVLIGCVAVSGALS